MKELSLHILDIAQNSISAGCSTLELTLLERDRVLTLTIADNGRGMTRDFVAAVTDPFTTTRTTRKVGLGLPLLRMAAEQTGGALHIESTVGVGTTVTATFRTDNIDCPPVGAMAPTVAMLVQGAPTVELTYVRGIEGRDFRFDTREVREILGPDISLADPEIFLWIQDYIGELEQSIEGAESFEKLGRTQGHS